MIIDCFRCQKPIESPCETNADYVIADDTVETVIEDGEPRDIRKTGIICTDCHKEGDIIIWGVHKEQN